MKRSFILFIFYVLLLILHSFTVTTEFKKPMNFVTVCDEEHFPWLLGLIKGIHKYNQGHTINIAVCDIGLKQIQKAELIRSRIKVFSIEMVHPDLCKKFIVRPSGRLARGWYAWKPVAMYQALSIFPYFLYIDSGKRVVGPLDHIFMSILHNGYFFFEVGHTIRPMTTQYVINKFNLTTPKGQELLDLCGLEAGIQGISLHIKDDYIKPLYLLAHDLRAFEDDGTAPWGFGGARHDQTLFSIQARLLNYKILECVNGELDTLVIDEHTSIPYKTSNFFSYKEYEENPFADQYKLK